MRPANAPALRAEEFGKRFRKACDESPHCPNKHEGRYRWIVEQYNHRRSDTISIETCRKWHEGESQARRDKIASLAAILGVNAVWLETGFSPGGDGQDKVAGNQREVLSIPVQIRADVIVRVENVPDDLTAGEAKRIAKVIEAYASDL